MHRSIFLVAILLLLGGPAYCAEAAQSVQNLNLVFREVYAQARHDVRDSLGPVIIAARGTVILLKDGKRDVKDIITPEYSVLKTVDHTALAVFVVLNDKTDSVLSQTTIDSLTRLQTAIGAAEGGIRDANLPPLSLSRSLMIIAECQDFLNKTLAARRVSDSDLSRFAFRLGKPSLGNADDAVVYELGALDKQVHEWKAQMTPEQWQRLRVVVAGGHMPRQHERVTQYFFALLKQKQEGGQVIYMDDMATEDDALNLLATHELDRRIAVGFFHDEWRMHRDLLSDAARKYLKDHKPKP